MQPALSQIIESIIFVAEQPVSVAFLLEALNGAKEGTPGQVETIGAVSEEEVQAALHELLGKYSRDTFPFEVRRVAGGYQFFTKQPYYPYVRQAVIHKNQKRLSRAALETLAIVAYRQPVAKAQIEFIRGVNCDYALQKLLDKQLLSITGRSDAPGRPLLYGTSPFFMQYFGLDDLSELPKLKEFETLAEDHLEEFRQHQAKQAASETDSSTQAEDGQVFEEETEQ
jgi:segregation and condensation protein B